MSTAQRIALFGGSFDPIHFGHLISARSIAEQLDLSRVILIPAPRPPHKPNVVLTDTSQRIAMARLAVEGDPLFSVSDIEMKRGGPSYTIDTVSAFRAELGASAVLHWIIGADSLPELVTWRRIAELVTRVTIVTATRPGWTPPDLSQLAGAVGREQAQSLLDQCCATPAIDISATDIRGRVAANLPIRYLVPAAVASYIVRYGLYRPERCSPGTCS
ncbi:MAG: nicotinate-nucleotide adenylyltransferase [Planctomycetota bacterium]